MLDADAFSRQLLRLQRLSRVLDPFDAWPAFEHPQLHHFCALSPVRDSFPAVVRRWLLIDVWG